MTFHKRTTILTLFLGSLSSASIVESLGTTFAFLLWRVTYRHATMAANPVTIETNTTFLKRTASSIFQQ